MKDEQRPVHQLEHAEPTVIHHPEEDMTVLARWLKHGMEQGPRFWVLLGGVVVAVLVVVAIGSGVAGSKAAGSEAWVELTQAKSAEEKLKIAEAHPNTPVAGWARIDAAEEEYTNGIIDLTSPGKKELAGPRLQKALALFQQVAKEAPKDSTQQIAAYFGAARTLEARNELPEAIEQYRLVASKFPNAPEAKRALALAKALEEPVNATFYKELYAYKAPANPPTGLGGPGSLFQGLNPGIGNLPGANLKQFLPDLTTPSPGPVGSPPSTGPIPATSTPIPPPIEPGKTEPPKAEAPKSETPKVEPPKTEAPKVEPPATPAEPPKTATPPRS